MPPLVWLITGASSGLGFAIAKAALAAGYTVIATSRNPSKSATEAAELERSGNAAWMKLDVASDQLEQQLQACVEKFGRVCRGRRPRGTTLPAIRAQFETNFFGAIRITQAIIPLMRQQSSGTVVNISGTEGICTVPGLSIYSASKHALEAVSEGLSGELAPFGIRVLSVQPGAMRTKFLDPSNAVEVPVSEPYKRGPVEQALGWVMGNAGKESIDPEMAAKRIVEAVAGGGEGWPEGREKFLRLPLGREAGKRFAGKIESLRENADAVAVDTRSVDFDE